jgi:hypothetical protein
MSDYSKATNFTAKDTLPTGNPSKIVKGTEIDVEFTAVASAVTSKADLLSPALLGVPTAPTAISGTNTTQLATTAFVTTAFNTLGTMSTQNANAVAITGGTITGITDLAVADGGTGSSTFTANSVVLGNGTSALNANMVAPSSDGNVLTSNGTTWISAAPKAGGFGQAFTSSGTFTIPVGVTAIKITVVGGGANGGAGYTPACSNPVAGDGGKGSGVAVKFATGLTPGGTLTVTVGASNGGTSTVVSGTQSITTISASTTAVSGGTVNTVGPNGGIGSGNAQNGSPGGTGGAGFAAFGGGGSPGAGAGGAGGAGYGGGGGGGGDNSGGGVSGGAGKQGIVVFEW